MCLEANAAPACVGVITWMHTFSPAKMWIRGLTHLTKPMAHLHTQFNRELPWSQIDMDFMNLNQSAHGDREFGFVVARLRLEHKIVVGHWQDSDVIAELEGWSRVACAVAESRRLKIVRFGGMNMREVAVTGGDRVEAEIQFGWSINGHAVGDLVERIAEVRDAEIEHLVEEYEAKYVARPGAAPGRRPPREPAPCRSARDRNARLPHERRLRSLHHDVRGSPWHEPASWPCLPAPDGRWLRIRGRGGLEDGSARATDEGHVRGSEGWRVVHGGLHVPSGQRRGEGPRGAHARSLPFDRRRRSPRSRSIRSASAAKRPPAVWSSMRRPDRQSPPRSSTWAGGCD